MAQSTTPLDHYLSAFKTFEGGLNGQASHPVHKVRQGAIRSFEDLGFPTSRDESWKSISLAPITDTPFIPSAPGSLPAVTRADLAALSFGLEGPRLVFVNGFYQADLSDTAELPGGVVVVSIAEALERDLDGLSDHLARYAEPDAHAFTALNTAFLRDGVYIHVPANVVCETPIHVIYYGGSNGAPTSQSPRSLVVVGENAQATFVETYAGRDGAKYFTNAVTEIAAGDSAVVDHYKVILEGDCAVHVANHHARQGRGANVSTHAITIGGAFVRNDASSVLAGEGGESTLNGLYVLRGDQHCDNYTLLDHAEPHCPSHELYKGILADNARTVFRGKIHVHQKAQKTDAYQQNQNILLSEEARVNTKPQLEIYADDVKCSHGATIGQLDDDAMFYLQARGISRPNARRMLLEAFARDILDRVKPDGLRDALTDIVLDKVDTACEAQS